MSPSLIDVVYVVADMITGGTQTHLLEVFRRLDRQRFRPHLFVLRDGGNLLAAARDLDVAVRTFGMRGSLRDPRDWAGLVRMVGVLRSLRPQVIHGYLLRGNFYGSLAGRLAGVPAVVTSKRGLHAPAGAAERLAVRVSNRLSDVITGNSPQVLEFTHEVERDVPAPMEMIPSGIDVARFDPDRVGSSPGDALREALGIGRRPVIGTAITFRPRKGFQLLFESFADVRERFPEVQLVLAGAAEMSPEGLALAEELDIVGAVHLLGRRADMPEVVSTFDIFVLPSESEGMSNAILEAMAMRKPVVVTAVGGAPVQVEEGRCGHLVDYPDRQAMTARLVGLLEDPAAARAMGEAGRARVLECFSSQAMVSRMQDLYAKLLGEKQIARA